MPSLQSDAVIIGAGHNSLACAAHLVAKGWSVELFEQAATLGGAVKTAGLTLPGFRHDWAAMNLSPFAGSSFFSNYNKDLIHNGLELIPVAKPFASAFPDGNWLGVSNNAEVTTARIASFSEKDAETWATLTTEFPAKAEHIVRVLGSRMNLSANALMTFNILRKAGISGSLSLARFLMSSPRQWLDEIFVSEQVKATLAAWGMHLDFAPDIAGGAVYPYLEAMSGQAFGMVLGKGGADTIIKAMGRMIEACGGRIECNAPVVRILHSGGRASGVLLADGRRVHAKKAVIANVAPHALARMTGGTGSSSYDTAIARFNHAPGTMMIHLAMQDLPDWKASPELREFAYVHMAPSMDQMARTYQQARAGLLPDEPVIVCGQPTAIDPSRAPSGKHVLWLQVRMVPGDIRGDAGGEITATDWAEAGEAFAERVLGILESYAPGTRRKIQAQRIVTPAELEAENPNLVGGDQICGSHHLTQNFLFRPARGHADGTTPIKNLYHTGAAVWPGAGTGAGPGFLLAQKLAGN
ncbi:MAG: NAD(P)/FAD-dependent oxidoreductase [Paracoccaceae bacterium]